MCVFCTQSAAQLCSGSLGDPVVNETFGSGTATFGRNLLDTTSYTYIADLCPNDGYYTLAHSVGNCFSNSWHYLSQDHTGDPNGYMMIVNASPSPGVFFTYPVHGLCTGSTYEFGAWITNMILSNECGGAPKLPNITFSIETTTGTVLASYSTGSIPTTGTGQWNQYNLDFKTPPGVSDVILKMSNANTQAGGCGNDLAIDDITFRPCGPIVAADFSSSNSNVPANLCVGYTGNFTISATLDASSYANVAYQWQFNNNAGSGWVNIAGANQASYTIQYVNAQLGSYQYRLAVGEAANINNATCRVVSNVLTVNVTPYPIASANVTKAQLCSGDTLLLQGGGGATYLWSGPSGFTSSLQNPTVPNVTQANAGTYTVKVTSAAGCSDQATTSAQVYPAFAVSGGRDTTVCKGQSVNLHAMGGTAYRWSPGTGLSDSTIANPIATPLVTTTYNVAGTNANGCISKAQVTITVPLAPTADAGSDRYVIVGQSTQLNGKATGNNVQYRWSPATGLSSTTVLNPIATPTADITYTLTVGDTCFAVTDNVFIKVYKQVVVPNTFSPNGDGVNDTWDIDALVAFPQSVITVYDRQGQVVYTDTGYTHAWDGKCKGLPLPTGTYYYIINIKSKIFPDMSGSVTIIR